MRKGRECVECREDAADSGESTAKGSPWLRELYEHFAPVREEILARGIPEEEVYADIDAAIAAVRAEKRARAEQPKPKDAIHD
jgi:hypothetical protein